MVITSRGPTIFRIQFTNYFKDNLPLTLIINKILDTGVFPDNLKIAKIIPIFKKDDRTVFNKYRPISLLPIMSKVVEKVIADQMNEFFVKNNYCSTTNMVSALGTLPNMLHLN